MYTYHNSHLLNESTMSQILVILLSVFLNPLLDWLHTRGYDLVNMLCVRGQGTARGEPFATNCALEGPLPCVLPLVRNQGVSALEHLLTKTAFKLRLFVLPHVGPERGGVAAVLAATLALELVIRRVLEVLVLVHLGLGVKGQEADRASRLRVNTLMHVLDMSLHGPDLGEPLPTPITVVVQGHLGVLLADALLAQVDLDVPLVVLPPLEELPARGARDVQRLLLLLLLYRLLPQVRHDAVLVVGPDLCHGVLLLAGGTIN